MESGAIVSRWKRKVLEVACAVGNVDIAQAVLKSRVEISAADSAGRTPIYTAARNGHWEVLGLLMEAGGDITISDNDGRTPLYVTAFHGHVKAAELLLRRGADLSIVNKFGRTPLSLAACEGHFELAKLFIENGANVEEADVDGWTPLLLASDEGHADVVQLLLSCEADIATTNRNDGWTPLYAASVYGHDNIVRILLEHGANPAIRTISGRTPLYVASFEGHINAVRELLAKGAEIAILTDGGHSPLGSASYNGHVAVVQLLVENGGDPNHRDKNSSTPLNLAASRGHASVIGVLLANGGDPTIPNNLGATPLYAAVRKGYLEAVKILLENRADLSRPTNDTFGNTLLIENALHGDVEVAQLLLRHGADIAATNSNGQTALQEACRRGHIGVAKLLLQNGADANVVDVSGETPLVCAANNGHDKVIQLLLDNGADHSSRAQRGWTALHCASSCGHTEVVKTLLSGEADIDEQIENELWTPLHLASGNGHVSVVKILLDNGAKTAITNHHGRSPLHFASVHGHADVVEALLAHHADASVADKYGRVPLVLAAEFGHIGVTRALLKSSATDSDQNGLTALHAAVANGNVEVIKVLLENGAPMTHTKIGGTPLHLAVGHGKTEVVRVLLENGADILAADNDGVTSLHVASQTGHIPILELLLGSGASMVPNTAGLTPIHFASVNGRVEAVKALIEHGADIFATEKSGLTPLHAASEKGDVEVIAALLEHGADIAAVAIDGTTAVHSAARGGNLEAIQLLLDNGASTDPMNASGSTPTLVASVGGHSEVIKLLLRYGADANLQNQHGMAPLHLAADLGHLEAIKQLLRGGADVAAADELGRTPLFLASVSGRTEATKELLAHGADPSARNNKGIAPILAASEGGHIEVARLLLEHGSNLAVADPEFGMTPLVVAIYGGHVELVKLLIEKQADPIIARNDGRRPVDPFLFTAYLAQANQERNLKRVGSDRSASPPIGEDDDQSLAAASAMGHTRSNSIESESPSVEVEAGSEDMNELCSLGPEARATLCDVCCSIFQNGTGRIMGFDMFSTLRELLPVLIGRNPQDEPQPLPHPQPHTESYLFLHHFTVQSLFSAALQGCYICSSVWDRVDRRMRQTLLDLYSTSTESEPPPLPLTFWCQIDVNDLMQNHLKPEDLGPNLNFWGVNFHPEIMKMLNHSSDDISFFTFTPFEEAKGFGFMGDLSCTTGSAESLEFAAGQLQSCEHDHKECNVSRDDNNWLPSRLICLDGMEEDESVRLVLSRDINPGPYCTLSHCWGSGEFIKLSKDNLNSFSCKIPMSDLPKTFRESMLVARKLGLRYIWIDSLCIIQDDPDDWFNEASQMYKVYSNSMFNICATTAIESSQGLFTSRDPTRLQRCEANIPWYRDGGSFQILDMGMWNNQILNAPLNMRAWVVQEQLLSPRNIHFGPTQIFWECLETTTAEQFPHGMPKAIPFFGQSARRQLHQSSYDSQNEQQSKALESCWTEIVNRYAKAKFSHPEDRIIAFSGITRKFELMLSKKCDAGLWRDHILRDILWYVESCRQGDGTPSERPETYRAPSFSWMAVEGAITLDSQTEITGSLAQVLVMTIEKSKGCITGGSLTLQGIVKPLRLFRSKGIGGVRWVPKFRHGKHHLGWAVSITSVVYMDVDQDYDDTYYCILLTSKFRASSTVAGLILRETGRERGEFTRIGCLLCMGEDKEFLTSPYDDEDCYPSELYDDVQKKHTISIV